MRRPWVTRVLAVVWVAVHVLALALSPDGSATTGPWWSWGRPAAEVLARLGAEVPGLVEAGDVQRLVTHAFLHGTALHLLLNVLVWLFVGGFLERVIGPGRLWIVFVVAVVAGGLAHLQWRTVPAVGASAGVFGTAGALGVWAFTSRRPDARRARASVVLFLVLSAALSFALGARIGHEAHLGGLAGGIVTILALGPRRSEGPPGRGVGVAAVALGLLVLAAGAVQAAAGTTAGTSRVRAFLAELRETERLADRLYRHPHRARAEQRRELAERLDALEATEWLDGWEGEAALRAYLDVWRAVADANVPDPFAFERRLAEARAAWWPHRDRLRLESGMGPGP